ncbi:BrnT family toxin [Methylobacterium sp. WL103]|nr:BrnT family toxin [Methylobacterium sp. WL103]TXM96893.1 BrnT family toxin [Methylobacterium sp. WL103]
MTMRFEWDADKTASNLRRHGVRFETAARVFTDPFAITSADRIEDRELRWRIVGMADTIRVLVVVHTIREATEAGEEIEVVRIISARKADRSERRSYEDEAG